ncbi:hypothetical protein ACIBI9_18485 [Nonomuraea sp. NPDC050451]|uniref:hypothetical protein n=1 Tax=Nonomuraea sp. NPDC050451 TaxID=3364364 RepID=UPI00379401F9
MARRVAMLSAALLFRGRAVREGVPALGLVTWVAQGNMHGLVSVYGFVVGAAVWGVGLGLLHPDRDLQSPPRTTVAALTNLFARLSRT